MATVDVAARRRTITIIWIAMLASIVIYVVAAYVVATIAMPGGASKAAVPGEPVMMIVVGVSLVAAIAAGVWRRRALVPEALARGGEPMRAYQTAHVIGWAIGEIPALVGFVATILTGDVRFVISGAVVSLALTGLAFRPSAESLDAAARAARSH